MTAVIVVVVVVVVIGGVKSEGASPVLLWPWVPEAEMEDDDDDDVGLKRTRRTTRRTVTAVTAGQAGLPCSHLHPLKTEVPCKFAKLVQ